MCKNEFSWTNSHLSDNCIIVRERRGWGRRGKGRERRVKGGGAGEWMETLAHGWPRRGQIFHIAIVTDELYDPTDIV